MSAILFSDFRVDKWKNYLIIAVSNDMDCLIILRFLYLACFVISTYVIFISVCWILMAYESSATYLSTRLLHAGLYNGRQIELFHIK